MSKPLAHARFDGSLWCNLDVALRNLDQVFNRVVQPFGLTIIEWYILRALYERDGQHASALARAVGRAATSFTPNLDKLYKKGFIERQSDSGDRRAICIYLTSKAHAMRDDILNAAVMLDEQLKALFDDDQMTTFMQLLVELQILEASYIDIAEKTPQKSSASDNGQG